MKEDGSYQTCNGGNILYVHPSSVMFNRKPETGFVIFHDITETKKKFMRDLTVVERDWLIEVAGHYYQYNKKTKQKILGICRILKFICSGVCILHTPNMWYISSKHTSVQLQISYLKKKRKEPLLPTHMLDFFPKYLFLNMHTPSTTHP
ncbi:hypothetical protein BY996DRAFT_3485629 [Phakopsora pachyrhizi]|nr:hypothetical protein BY996DRAFT_3485629 [Phakopsora pachyrhizi]